MRHAQSIRAAGIVIGLLALSDAGARGLTAQIGGATAGAPEQVSMRAPDGLVLKGSYRTARASGPAIILMHACNTDGDRHQWDSAATAIATAGIRVLTLDNRGAGETGGDMPPPPPPPSAPPTFPLGMTSAGLSLFPASDIDTALAFLKSKPGVDAKRMAIGGCSCTAAEAAEATLHHPELRALVLLSGLPSPHAASEIAGRPALPVFAIYSTQDNGANSIRAFMSALKHPASTLKIFPGTLHGFPLFTAHPALTDQLARWLSVQLAR